MKIKLMTEDQQLVYEAVLPAFNKYPDVVLWGSRVFKFHLVGNDLAIYTEAFSYTLP